MNEFTPSMQQYLKAKAEHPDCVLLFRMGDFYETFFDDAVEVSKILDIALTSRNKDDPNPIPMAGVPYHAVQGYIVRLLSAGKKVAICEQVEDPKLAKGIVRREVVRVITPGVLLDTEIEDETKSNLLVCIKRGTRGFAITALDASTGLFAGATALNQEQLMVLLNRLGPSEILISEDEKEIEEVIKGQKVLITYLPLSSFETNALWNDISEKVVSGPQELVLAQIGILSYLKKIYPALLLTVQRMVALLVENTMYLPPTTIKSLEIIETMKGRSEGSLFRLLNRTKTPMASRLLKARLISPVTDIDEINRRLDIIESFVGNPVIRTGVLEALSGVRDIERILTRVVGGGGTCRDLKVLAEAILSASKVNQIISDNQRLAGLVSPTDELLLLAGDISNTFVDNPPISTKEGGMVRPNVNKELDEARDLSENGKRYIAEYEAKERQRTGIPGLKIRYNRVFGYLIEVTNAHKSKVPSHYERRQTLVSAERYTTKELLNLESQVVNAEERAKAIEAEIFDSYVKRVVEKREDIQRLAKEIAEIDLSATLAEIAHLNSWCRPVVGLGKAIRIIGGRHPIVEASLPPNTFVSNDYEIDGENITLDILTGPNMAGKSTVMRQVALIVLLAQVGSFVPAESAEIGVADAIFTRVGAMDEISLGRSTFMVEMAETAEILTKATDRSLVLLDEIGRGTSTFDGVAIAWAVAEYIQSKIGCRTMFATHYHELTDLVRSVHKTRNLSIAVKEWGGDVLFLRKIVDGPSSKSYGIQVARLAGLPQEVIERAKQILSNLESQTIDALGKPKIAREGIGGRQKVKPYAQLDMFGVISEQRPDPVIERIKGIDTDRITPLEALQILSELVTEVKGRR